MSMAHPPISAGPSAAPGIEASSPGPLRVAVVGAGRWGRLHAGKLAAVPGVEVAAIVDREPARARAAAAAHGARAVTSARQLLDGCPVDAAVVAVDLPELAPVTAAMLDAGLHVLAEKPLAMRAADARTLVALAARRRRLLAVGFVERFLAPAGPGRRLVCRRVGPEGPATPLGLDWMVHDIDHALRCLGPDLRVADADFAGHRARIRLVGEGREARLTAVRRRGAPWRRLWLDGRRVDLTAGRDPLAAEIRAFCRAVRGGAPGRLASGADAAAALALLEDAGFGDFVR